MAEYIVRPRAQIDLEDIWRYTLDNWGEAQADRYLGELFAAFRELGRDPTSGQDASYLRPGYLNVVEH